MSTGEEFWRQEVERRNGELKASEARYRLLVSLGRAINSSLDLRQVFRQAAEGLHQLLNCDRSSLILVSKEEVSPSGFAVEFEGEPTWLEVPPQNLADSAVEWVLGQRRSRVVRRLAADSPFIEDRRLWERGYRASVWLPLTCRKEGLGVLELATRRENQVEDWDLVLLEDLSSLLATALDNAAAYSEISRLKAQLEQENVYLRQEVRSEGLGGNLVGRSAAVTEVRRAVAQVAPTDSTVLILGETGTGKELIARAVHEHSPRRQHLLVKVNCAALAPGVINSELFGHEPGAFTGALKRRLGRFEMAHQGTLFLDEVGELPSETQVLLLRVLQEREIERVGGSEPIHVDVRVIAATHRDLKAAVEQGDFRADLFYRLHIFPIRVPPLRQRPEDVPTLVEHFLRLFNRRMNKRVQRVSPATMESLVAYSWPGNVRELQNVLERAMIVSSGDTLEVDPTWLVDPAVPADTTVGEQPALAELERRAILEALERCGGKIYGPGGAAAALGLKPSTLYGKMRKHRIHRQPGSPRFE